MSPIDYHRLREEIRRWGRELGFQQVGFARRDLGEAEGDLLDWLAEGMHGEMEYMARHGLKRSRPELLVPGTLSIVSVRLEYWPGEAAREPWSVLGDPGLGYVSRYALGRDYHKPMRRRLARLAGRIRERIGEFGHRAFVDSAPVLEKPLARLAGLGWQGKHSNLIHRSHGSWFFLGELYTDLPLPPDDPEADHCGRCSRCIDVCPTDAIPEPYRVDARRCISYLTIELHGPIPEPLRPLLGNRIYGCDDCQLVCPWNRFATATPEADFLPRHGLDAPRLADLFRWEEETFLQRTEGSPIRRLGHPRWLRNLAVALGHSGDTAAIPLLRERLHHPSALVREHVRWALDRLERDR